MMFQKAGEAGWKSIIPIWNTLIILKMVGREWWWIILLLIPIVGFVIWIIVANDLSKSFGRGAGHDRRADLPAVHLLIILGFGDAEYQGPAAAPAAAV